MVTTPFNPEDILNCEGKTFFDNLEKHLKTKIQSVIRNILMINDLDTALVFATFTESVIGDLENFIRNVFNHNMLIGDESMANYLGRYADCKEQFTFSYGQKVVLKLIASTCKQLYVQHSATSIPNGSDLSDDFSNTTSNRSDVTSSESESKKELFSSLYRSVYRWIRNQKALEQVRHRDFKKHKFN